jgi:hypothetical protein
MCTTYGYQCQYGPDDGPAARYAENSMTNSITEKPNSISSPLAMHPSRGSSIDAIEGRNAIKEAGGHDSGISDHGILDLVKARYMGMHSLMTFPRTLGIDFQSANPPRVHSFAWNCGIRPEDDATIHPDLRKLVSRADFERYSIVYFETVHPAFSILDRDSFCEEISKFWAATTHLTSPFEAIIAGVMALGSFFSDALGHPREADLVLHAKRILEDSTLSPSIDHVSAWILRTLYLRSIARPHRGWMASCTAMHLAEATGLHHEMDAITLTGSGPTANHPVATNSKGCEQARRIFWIAWLINAMISYEYGRSAVVLSGISCKLPQANGSNDIIVDFISIAQLVPRLINFSILDPGTPTQSITLNTNVNEDVSLHTSPHGSVPDFINTLSRLSQIPDSHPFVSMSKADLCMSLYRHSRQLKLSMPRSSVQTIISIGNVAVVAAEKLASERKYWWNVLCSVFQYVCVLLALDTGESLANVGQAMESLERICEGLKTHMAREAIGTARLLVSDSVRKKRREVELLERGISGITKGSGGVTGPGAVGDGSITIGNIGQEEGVYPVAGLGMGEGLEIDWDALLDPWYMSVFAMQDFSTTGDRSGGTFVPTTTT